VVPAIGAVILTAASLYLLLTDTRVNIASRSESRNGVLGLGAAGLAAVMGVYIIVVAARGRRTGLIALGVVFLLGALTLGALHFVAVAPR
jgi:hypothetical protein